MTRRGRILRDTTVGPGLLVVDETQLQFTLERMWRSDVPPLPGMVVDVEVNGSDVVSVCPVPRRQLAREYTARSLRSVRRQGAAVATVAVSLFGIPTLVASGTVIAGWFVLAAGSLATPLGRVDFTFWQVLGAVNSGSEAVLEHASGARGSTGIYGMLAMLALGGPFIWPLWKDRRAHLGGMLPLLLMLVVAWKAWNLAGGSGAGAAVALSGADADLVSSLTTGIRNELRRGMVIGGGVYAAGAAAAYLALLSLRRYLAAVTSVR